MPGFDRTGPGGQGSRTGRQLGKCNSNNAQSVEQESSEELQKRMGLARGKGLGRKQKAGKGKGSGRGLGRGNA